MPFYFVRKEGPLPESIETSGQASRVHLLLAVALISGGRVKVRRGAVVAHHASAFRKLVAIVLRGGGAGAIGMKAQGWAGGTGRVGGRRS